MNVFNSIRVALFAVSDREATFEIRGFDCPDQQLKSHLETVGKKFLYGYHKALAGASNKHLAEQLQSVDPLYRGFSYEGAAMALMILDRLNPFRRNSLKAFINNEGRGHIYMLHVGAGWALARLPFNLERSLKRFDPVYKWLVVDGYGFHQAYFKTAKYVDNARLPQTADDYTRHAFCQGVGRALWFVSGGQPARLSDMINKYPVTYHADLWSGVGLACTYAGGVQESVIKQIRELGKSFSLHLAQGAVFAAKARMRAGNVVPHTEMSLKLLTGINIQQASAIADEALTDVRAVGHLPAFEVWRDRIRKRIQSIHIEKSQNPILNEKIYS